MRIKGGIGHEVKKWLWPSQSGLGYKLIIPLPSVPHELIVSWLASWLTIRNHETHVGLILQSQFPRGGRGSNFSLSLFSGSHFFCSPPSSSNVGSRKRRTRSRCFCGGGVKDAAGRKTWAAEEHLQKRWMKLVISFSCPPSLGLVVNDA